MPYLVKVRGGYLSRGRVVKDAEQATAYTSPSAAERGLQQAIDGGAALRGKVVPVLPSAPSDPTAAKRTAAVKARLEENGGKRLPVKLLGRHVKKLQAGMKAGTGDSQQAVILKLIDDADFS